MRRLIALTAFVFLVLAAAHPVANGPPDTTDSSAVIDGTIAVATHVVATPHVMENLMIDSTPDGVDGDITQTEGLLGRIDADVGLQNEIIVRDGNSDFGDFRGSIITSAAAAGAGRAHLIDRTSSVLVRPTPVRHVSFITDDYPRDTGELPRPA
jgi:hypothetical protein